MRAQEFINVTEGVEGIKKMVAIGVKLQDIPAFDKAGTGAAKIVDTGDRIMAVINIQGVNIPYYISTGEGGKASVPVGKWYPFFGTGPSGWLNKGSEQSINKFYGSGILKTYANMLNQMVGDLRDQPLPPMKKAGRAVINRDMLNPQDHFTSQEEAAIFKKRINTILKQIGSEPFYQEQPAGDIKEAKDGIGSVQSVFGDVNDMKAMTQLSIEQLNRALSMGLGKGTIVARKFSKYYGSAFIYDVKLSDGEWKALTIIINPQGRVYGWLGSTIFENLADSKKPGRKGVAEGSGQDSFVQRLGSKLQQSGYTQTGHGTWSQGPDGRYVNITPLSNGQYGWELRRVNRRGKWYSGVDTAKEVVSIFKEYNIFSKHPVDENVAENFHDGKKPGRKGLAKRVGVNCKQPVSKLRSIAKNSSGEKQRMAHWCANMKSGKK